MLKFSRTIRSRKFVQLVNQINVGIAPWGVAISKDGATAYVSNWGGRPPLGGDLKGVSMGAPIVVDIRGIAASGTVSIVDLKKGVEISEVPSETVIAVPGREGSS